MPTQFSTHIGEYVLIQPWDKHDVMHIKIAEYSAELHVKATRETTGRRLEWELDRIVATLYGISDTHLDQIRESYAELTKADLVELSDKDTESVEEEDDE